MSKIQTTITLPPEIRDRAKEEGINISKACVRGIKLELGEPSDLVRAKEMKEKIRELKENKAQLNKELKELEQISEEMFGTSELGELDEFIRNNEDGRVEDSEEGESEQEDEEETEKEDEIDKKAKEFLESPSNREDLNKILSEFEKEYTSKSDYSIALECNKNIKERLLDDNDLKKDEFLDVLMRAHENVKSND